MIGAETQYDLTEYGDEDAKFGDQQDHGELTWNKVIDQLCASYRISALYHDSQILIVDDDWASRDRLCAILNDLHYGVDVARTGSQALDRITQNPYQLVILELNLPDMDGIELYDRLRQLRSHHELEVVLLTEDTSSETIPVARQRGIRGILSKPVDLVELVNYVHRFVDGQLQA